MGAKIAVSELHAPPGLPGPAAMVNGLVMDPAFRSAWAMLGVIFDHAQHPHRALRMLMRAHFLGPEDQAVVLVLIQMAIKTGQGALAITLLEKMPAAIPTDLPIAEYWVKAHHAMGDYESMRARLVPLLAHYPERADFCAMMAEALEGLGKPTQARHHQMEAVRLRGGVLTIPAKSQAETHILFLCSGSGADLPIDFLFDHNRFEMSFVYPTALDPGTQIPEIDLVFNAAADPDIGLADFDAVGELATRHPVIAKAPLLNRPKLLPRTRRDQARALFAGIDGILVPETQRLTSADLDHLARQSSPWDGAKLVRTAGTHGGDALDKVESADQLSAFLQAHPADHYYLTDYVDYRSHDGWFRKYRFIFINRKPHPFHLAIMDHWKIHYWRAGMSVDAWRCAEEEAFMRDPRSAFSPQALAAIDAIARAMDLDYGGLDCALMPDGRVIVFEANAAMLVHLNDDPVQYPYKHELVPKIRDAMSDFLLSQAADRRSP